MFAKSANFKIQIVLEESNEKGIRIGRLPYSLDLYGAYPIFEATIEYYDENGIKQIFKSRIKEKVNNGDYIEIVYSNKNNKVVACTKYWYWYFTIVLIILEILCYIVFFILFIL